MQECKILRRIHLSKHNSSRLFGKWIECWFRDTSEAEAVLVNTRSTSDMFSTENIGMHKMIPSYTEAAADSSTVFLYDNRNCPTYRCNQECPPMCFMEIHTAAIANMKHETIRCLSTTNQIRTSPKNFYLCLGDIEHFSKLSPLTRRQVLLELELLLELKDLAARESCSSFLLFDRLAELKRWCVCMFILIAVETLDPFWKKWKSSSLWILWGC